MAENQKRLTHAQSAVSLRPLRNLGSAVVAKGNSGLRPMAPSLPSLKPSPSLPKLGPRKTSLQELPGFSGPSVNTINQPGFRGPEGLRGPQETPGSRRDFLKKKTVVTDFPSITSESYCVVSVKNRFEMIAGQRQSIKRRIASMTKVMTLTCSLKLVKRFHLNPSDTLVKVKKTAGSTPGTSARLREGDYILLEDLFYGLMLPSGNDAANCLAEFFGKRLQQLEPAKKVNRNVDRIQTFVSYMNKEAIEMGMTDTL